MNYTTVENPVWNKEQTAVNCFVTFTGLGRLPFAADPRGPEDYVIEIYNRCVAGEFGPIAEYVPAPDEGPQEPSVPPEQQIPVTNPGEVL